MLEHEGVWHRASNFGEREWKLKSGPICELTGAPDAKSAWYKPEGQFRPLFAIVVSRREFLHPALTGLKILFDDRFRTLGCLSLAVSSATWHILT